MTPVLSRRAFVAAAAGLAFSGSRAQTGVKLSYGYSAVTDYATVFIAADQSMFAKRGIDIDLHFIPLNPTIIPGVQSGSLQIGGPTPTAFLQAVAGGLDLVAIAGGGVLSKSFTEVGLVVPPGSSIRTAADCVGSKIGIPGLGALLHVSFRQWLKINGVDQSKVTFVEAPFPQHADLLRSHNVDALVTAGPFMSRIVSSGEGKVASYYTTFLPEGQPTIVHVATRQWVEKNPVLVKAFRESIEEAAAFMAQPANEAGVRAALAKYLKLPAAIAQGMQISPPGPKVTPKQLQWWGGLMREQGYLKAEPNYASLVVKG